MCFIRKSINRHPLTVVWAKLQCFFLVPSYTGGGHTVTVGSEEFVIFDHNKFFNKSVGSLYALALKFPLLSATDFTIPRKVISELFSLDHTTNLYIFPRSTSTAFAVNQFSRSKYIATQGWFWLEVLGIKTSLSLDGARRRSITIIHSNLETNCESQLLARPKSSRIYISNNRFCHNYDSYGSFHGHHHKILCYHCRNQIQL